MSNIDDISSTKDTVLYKCPEHGIQKGRINNLINGHGCPECGRSITREKTKKDKQSLINQIESINGNALLNPKEYINAHTSNLKILCGSCGKNIYTTSLTNYRHGQQRCSECSRKESMGERKIRIFLQEHHISYQKQKTFQDLKDDGYLFFDFYLPKQNLCIQFDGQQHFDERYYLCINKEHGHQSFLKLQKHDKMKDKYCKQHRISLVRIKYTKINHIDEILENNIKY